MLEKLSLRKMSMRTSYLNRNFCLVVTLLQQFLQKT